MLTVLGRIFRLARRTALGPGAAAGLVAYSVVLGLQLFGVWISLRMIDWSRDFFDALEQVDGRAALHQVGVFAVLTVLSAGNFLAGDWLRKDLLMRWRTRLTGRALDVWMGKRAYWRLRPGLSPDAVDNPDQRVADDCRIFVNGVLGESLDLISNVVAIVSYVAVLWALSSFPLAFSLGGVEVAIPRYMVWAAFLYVALSSLLTHVLGAPLKALVFRRERCEADFRHALVQLRESADAIAQAGGEPAERRRLDGRFDAIRGNWRQLINRELMLGLFTRPYMQTVLRVPTFLALPAYFAGAVTLGGLMQLASAFSNVATTLSWFIFSYRDLAELVAVSERLDGLFAAAADPRPMPDAPRAIRRRPSPDGALRLRGLRLATPHGRLLDPLPDCVIAPGARVWISGASGQGKSTFLAALSGVWPYGEGEIGLPPGRMMFLPQAPHVFVEGMAAAACYPDDPGAHPRARIEALLTRLGLGHRLAGLDLPGPGALQGLSMGERQRLAFARLLLARPDWVILDEATSALDARAEADLLALLRASLPRAAILCVSHSPPRALAPYVVLPVGPAEPDLRRA